MPDQLAERYQAALADPQLMQLRGDVAVLEARLSQLLTRVDSGESGHRWLELGGAWQRFQQASRLGDGDAMASALDDVGQLIAAGQRDHLAWREVGDVLEQRRRIIDSERKRLIDLRQVITVERALTMAGGILGVIRQHVSDAKLLDAIADDIRAVLAVDHS
jgi:hypothetical protein